MGWSGGIGGGVPAVRHSSCSLREARWRSCWYCLISNLLFSSNVRGASNCAEYPDVTAQPPTMLSAMIAVAYKFAVQVGHCGVHFDNSLLEPARAQLHQRTNAFNAKLQWKLVRGHCRWRTDTHFSIWSAFPSSARRCSLSICSTSACGTPSTPRPCPTVSNCFASSLRSHTDQ